MLRKLLLTIMAVAGLAVAPHPDHAGPEDFIGAAEKAAANAVERRVDVGEAE